MCLRTRFFGEVKDKCQSCVTLTLPKDSDESGLPSTPVLKLRQKHDENLTDVRLKIFNPPHLANHGLCWPTGLPDLTGDSLATSAETAKRISSEVSGWVYSQKLCVKRFDFSESEYWKIQKGWKRSHPHGKHCPWERGLCAVSALLVYFHRSSESHLPPLPRTTRGCASLFFP